MRDQNLCCIVNLPTRKERYNHIVKAFKLQKEFVFKVFLPSPHTTGSVSLWITIKKIIETIDPDLDFFILCEDDHEFTSHYSFELLQKCINEAQQLDADILSGGVSWFKTGVQVSKDLLWLEKFSGLQQALDDWYLADKKDYETFAAKYPMNGEVKQEEQIDKMSEWCKEAEITHTPTIFINGKCLPER